MVIASLCLSDNAFFVLCTILLNIVQQITLLCLKLIYCSSLTRNQEQKIKIIFSSCIIFYFFFQVLRPGVLWFLRNLNDPDFNPVQEMIHLPIYRHLRRFILSVVRTFSKIFFIWEENVIHCLPCTLQRSACYWKVLKDVFSDCVGADDYLNFTF